MKPRMKKPDRYLVIEADMETARNLLHKIRWMPGFPESLDAQLMQFAPKFIAAALAAEREKEREAARKIMWLPEVFSERELDAVRRVLRRMGLDTRGRGE